MENIEEVPDKCQRKIRIPNRTNQQTILARAKCGNLYRKNLNISWILDNESYFTLGHSKINGNNIFLFFRHCFNICERKI